MKHKIRQAFWDKGWVFLLSVIDTYAIWSTHKTGDDVNKGGNHYASIFQAQHDEQIDELFEKAMREEEMKTAAEGVIIDDQTEESGNILKQRK